MPRLRKKAPREQLKHLPKHFVERVLTDEKDDGYIAQAESVVSLWSKRYGRTPMTQDVITEDQRHFQKFILWRLRQLGGERLEAEDLSDAEVYKRCMASDFISESLKFSLNEMTAVANCLIIPPRHFFFSRNLADMLAFTDLDCPSDMVRPPFEHSVFTFDSPAVRDLYLSTLSDSPYVKKPKQIEDPISAYILEREHRGERTIWIDIYQHAETRANRFASYSQSRAGLDIRLTEGVSVEDTIFASRPNLSKELGDLFRYILNAILYLSSGDPDTRTSSPVSQTMKDQAKGMLNQNKRESLLREADYYSNQEGMMVGMNMPPIVISKSKSDPSGQSNKPSAKNKRYVVRGHWRRQAHGEGRLQRKLVWIKPFWKGPEMAQVVERKYLVK